MKVHALVLGKYNNSSTFCLYRFTTPVSPPLNSPISTSSTKTTSLTMSTGTETKLDQSAIYYYCLEDLERLAILAPAASIRHVNTLQLYRDYPSAFFKNVIDGYTYANNHVLYELASCVKSKLLMGLCQLTEHTPLIERYSLLQQIPLLDTTSLANLLSLPPSSSLFSNSLPVQLVEQVLHPVRLDGQEWFLQPLIQHQQASPPPPQDQHSCYYPLPSNVGVTNMNLKTKESSLLLQRRLAPKLGHHAPHLTIHTPSYKDQHQSAPLRKSISKQQINRRLQAAAAATVKVIDTPHHRPSPSLIGTMSSSLYRHQKSIGATKQNEVATSSGTIYQTHHPSTTEKQSYDTLDLTQSQHSKLDNTIWRQVTTNSTILGKRHLPSSSSGLRQNVNDQVTRQMGPWASLYFERMEQCMGRLLVLEKKVASRQQQQQQQQQQQLSKITDKIELLDLVTRLDRLERKTAHTMMNNGSNSP